MFSADSALMRALSTVADVMILNALFIVTSLPVLTVGASLTALNFTAMRIATGECGNVGADYFRSFRSNFRQATVIGLVIGGLTAVFAAWYIVVPAMALSPLVELILLALWYILAFNFLTTVLFVFPYLASFEGRTSEVFRNARLMSWKHPLVALATLTLIVLSVGVTVFFPQTTGYGLFWLVIGFGAIGVINGRLFAHVFNKYIAAAAAPGQKRTSNDAIH